MALNSMTGYGRGTAEWNGIRFTVELASVNRRQLDIQIRLARELQMLEPQVCKVIGQAIHRGRITGEIALDYPANAPGRVRVELDRSLARETIRELRETGRELGLADNLSLASLCGVPQLLRFRESRFEAEAALPALLTALREALDNLGAMRTREGAALERALAKETRTLAATLKRIARRAPSAARAQRTALLKRIAQARLPLQNPGDLLAREVVQFADRSDITEELERLGSHLGQLRTLFSATGAVGREMDFLCQELNREINTIGSKSGDTRIIREVVAFKAGLERFREQVQNIE